MMKIVQVNCLYGVGSTGKIVASLYHFMKNQGDEPYVLYGVGKKRKDDHLIRTTPQIVRKLQALRSRITGYPFGGCVWGTAVALSALKRIRPDVVHIQCANCYMVNLYRLLDFLKKEDIPTVITNHAEFMFTGGCAHAVDCNKWLTGCYECDKIGAGYPPTFFFDRTYREWKLLKEIYQDFGHLTICCVSDWLRDRARRSPFFKGYPVVTVLNGVDTEVFHYRCGSNLKLKLGLLNTRIVIHVTPNFYNPNKGGLHVLEMAKRFPDVTFIIVGSDAPKGIGLRNCHFMGRILDQNLLACFYSMADVCLLTSLRETYSMVCAESLCCGTPVVGFYAGGPETIALHEYSTFVDQGNDDFLEKALCDMLAQAFRKDELSKTATGIYSSADMCRNYYKIYDDLTK